MSTWAEKVVWLEVTVRDPNDEYYEDYIGWLSEVWKLFNVCSYAQTLRR